MDKIAKIRAREVELRKLDSQAVKAVVGRHYRIADLRGVSKPCLIDMVLRAEFGARAVDQLRFEN